ncbi:hypothetical protein LPJ38_09485 [Bradyrhizobium daqingense]|uniref:Uncharacterized protein n=1 Tax=Bradyrhizobium daqingense TaxID=993502 RepID=A0A562L468_9BRAD|nr:hypothetical protein [Bradyrhizobium daqingense]TWI02467.1 hypothetical protein IQ17_04080 [Bradyrhizobium daqingense]UFS90934.1 hypothetical protein LPJ38_09485 [Bradyrhizobium daqingense]
MLRVVEGDALSALKTRADDEFASALEALSAAILEGYDIEDDDNDLLGRFEFAVEQRALARYGLKRVGAESFDWFAQLKDDDVVPSEQRIAIETIFPPGAIDYADEDRICKAEYLDDLERAKPYLR